MSAPACEARVRESFARQSAMKTLGFSVLGVTPGEVTLTLDFDPGLTQQHGFLHAGIITTGLDTAAGFAALSRMPQDAGVLTVEMKVSLMRPALGARFVFTGRVIKPGRTISFTEAVAYAQQGDKQVEIARLSATMMAITGRDDVKG